MIEKIEEQIMGELIQVVGPFRHQTRMAPFIEKQV